MNFSDNSGKISLSMLRGKPTNQSVPSISIRFNTGSEDLIKIYEKEEKDDLQNSSAHELTPEKEISNDSRESSPSRRDSKGLGHRSSSLDDSTTLSPEVPVSKSSDTSSLISRLTKTVEHKLNEIRNEKQKEKDSKLQIKEGAGQISSQESALLLANTEIGSTTSRAIESMKKFSLDSKESQDATSSPSKAKSSLVQDFTEQTNKLKSDFNKNFRPKISELRNRKSIKDSTGSRKSIKDSTGSPKIRSSIFQSLLGRDDGIASDDLLQECHAVDTAVEAYEDGLYSLDLEKENQNKIIKKDSSDNPVKQESIPVVLQDAENVPQKHLVLKPVEQSPKYFYRQLLREIIGKGKSVNTRYVLGLLFLCFLFPLPRFIAGAIFGASLTIFLVFVILQFIMPESEETSEYHDVTLQTYLAKNEDNILHVGWMNEMDTNYYPESYNVSQTHTVLLRLQGSLLQIDNSRKKINKHARPNEELQYGGFVHHREYDLTGSEVLLLPINLPRKWLWSRKYPIFIRFPTKSRRSPSSSHVSQSSTPTKAFKESNSRPQSPDELDGSSDSAEGQFGQYSTRSSAEDEVMNSSVDLESYEEVTQDMCHEPSLCLFARTDREKDDWFRRFVIASEKKPPENLGGASPLFNASTPEVEVSIPFEAPPPPPPPPSEGEPKDNNDADKEMKTPPQPPSYEQYMARIMDKDSQADMGVSWFNSFVGRVLFDFLHDKYWANKLQERVQRKLSKLHIPYFVGEIVVSGIELGNCVPQLISAGRPTVDHRGLWVDLNVSYSGSFRMTLETKLDLMKLKVKSPSGGPSSNPPSPSETPFPPYAAGRTRSYARSPSSECVLRNVQFDTDTDDSVESSSEEEQAEDEIGERAPGGGPASRRFLRIVDTVAASRYFQQASEWGLLQKAMKGVSNTRIELGVEVRRLKGTLTLNVPPAPSDRLWYGFRGSPELVMVAKPCLGERQLAALPFLAEFIQKQLRTVFEKVFVLPNMDDLVIPVMSPILLGQQEPPRPPWDHQTATGENPTPSPKTSPNRSNISLDLNQSFQKLKETYDD